MKVRALEAGYDNLCLRLPGDEFDMPDTVFDERPRLDANGKVLPGLFHDNPHWFEPLDEKLKEKFAKQQENRPKFAGVPAIDPGKQQADFDARNAKLVEEKEELNNQLAAAQAENVRLSAKLGEKK